MYFLWNPVILGIISSASIRIPINQSGVNRMSQGLWFIAQWNRRDGTLYKSRRLLSIIFEPSQLHPCKHSNGISPFSRGNTSSFRVHFPASYVSWSSSVNKQSFVEAWLDIFRGDRWRTPRLSGLARVGQPTLNVTPPPEIRPYYGLINYWLVSLDKAGWGVCR